MHPEINLSDYKATAVIDWLDIAVTLGRSTEFQYVQPELHSLLGLSALDKPIHVTAQNVAKATDAATGFVFRLQEHHHENNAAKIAYIVRGLEAFFGFTAPARIAGIEVAFDLKPKPEPKSNSKAIYVANAAMQYGIAAYGEHARQFTPRGHKKGRTVPLTLDPTFHYGGTFYEGHQTDEHGYAITASAHRGYPKKTDGLDEDNKPIPLPPSQHRARMEATLQLDRPELYGLTDPLALASYDFTKLADELHFRKLRPIQAIIDREAEELKDSMRAASHAMKATGKPTPAKELEKLRRRVNSFPIRAAAIASIYRNTDRISEWSRGWKGSEGRPLQHSKDTVPDAKLNRKVRDALQTLSEKMAEGVYPPAQKKRAKAR